jgi:hypothetical protein
LVVSLIISLLQYQNPKAHGHLGKISDFAAASFGIAAPIAPDSTRSRVFSGVLSQTTRSNINQEFAMSSRDAKRR